MVSDAVAWWSWPGPSWPQVVRLLADEPSSGLDVRETAELAAVLRIVQRDRGTALLLVEHDLEMVARIDRAIVMDLGVKVAEGTFDEVMADPTVRQAYLGKTA